MWIDPHWAFHLSGDCRSAPWQQTHMCEGIVDEPPTITAQGYHSEDEGHLVDVLRIYLEIWSSAILVSCQQAERMLGQHVASSCVI